MVYTLCTLLLKSSRKPLPNAQTEVNIAELEKTALEKKRKECLAFFENITTHVKNGPRGMDALWSTEEARNKCITDIVSMVNSYCGSLSQIVTDSPWYAEKNYFYWSSAYCPKQEIQYNDYRYDIAAMNYNLAAIIMTIVYYLIVAKSTAGTVSHLEKEAYRKLLIAAGYFNLCGTVLQTMKNEKISSGPAPVPFDSAIGIVKFLGCLAVAQAQEIGTSRALEADPKFTNDMPAKLMHQVYVLYTDAKKVRDQISSSNEAFMSISFFVVVKCDVFRVYAYDYAASAVFQASPATGLRYLDEANKHSALLEDYLKSASKKKIHLPFGVDTLIQDCLKKVKLNAERLRKINSLVHHAKPSTDLAALPAPQILAQKTEVPQAFSLPPVPNPVKDDET